MSATYGVMGMLDRCRDPSAPEPARLELLGDGPSLWDGDFLAESAPNSFRNCSLFMAAIVRQIDTRRKSSKTGRISSSLCSNQ